jgi:hypothetical protein
MALLDALIEMYRHIRRAGIELAAFLQAKHILETTATMNMNDHSISSSTTSTASTPMNHHQQHQSHLPSLNLLLTTNTNTTTISGETVAGTAGTAGNTVKDTNNNSNNSSDSNKQKEKEEDGVITVMDIEETNTTKVPVNAGDGTSPALNTDEQKQKQPHQGHPNITINTDINNNNNNTTNANPSIPSSSSSIPPPASGSVRLSFDNPSSSTSTNNEPSSPSHHPSLSAQSTNAQQIGVSGEMRALDCLVGLRLSIALMQARKQSSALVRRRGLIIDLVKIFLLKTSHSESVIINNITFSAETYYQIEANIGSLLLAQLDVIFRTINLLVDSFWRMKDHGDYDRQQQKQQPSSIIVSSSSSSSAIPVMGKHHNQNHNNNDKGSHMDDIVRNFNESNQDTGIDEK